VNAARSPGPTGHRNPAQGKRASASAALGHNGKMIAL